ncbi:cold-shock protein [Desulfogranum japonicum]|uniref:cold-shock protein n=1 Tax=Desulfogranum japonicum TaxID=231447 RepID=UPI0003F9617E|nr:cold-shock protein [Desulfogranum japonicum]
MYEGKVKWFNATKGYGFIQMENETKDVFVHHSAIEMEGYRSLQDGDRVSFSVVQGKKGLAAEGVKVLK